MLSYRQYNVNLELKLCIIRPHFNTKNTKVDNNLLFSTKTTKYRMKINLSQIGDCKP